MNNAMSLICNPCLHHLKPKLLGASPRNVLQRTCTNFQVKCSASGTSQATISEQDRLSDIYKPTVWNDTVLQSIENYNADELYKERAKKLEEEVTFYLYNESGGLLTTLELIDHVQRLGLGKRFKTDIQRILGRFHSSGSLTDQSLHCTALSFRLFRQNGFKVSQDLFKNFIDEQGNFRESLATDVNGILNLYEASFLAFEEEDILDRAKEFATASLQNLQKTVNSERIIHALELPVRHRIDLLEARWYIEEYGKREDANVKLLELAKINYNMVQSVLQRDLKDSSRWWNELGLASKLPFSRDRLMECFFWAIGMFHEPPFSAARKGLTKVTAFVLTVDDVYDIYGTVEELELYTDAVVRWDVEAVKDLPVYMRLCFLALFNNVNDLGYETLKDQQGDDVIPYLKKAWLALCKAFLQEAKWNYFRTTPRFEDYLENGWRSASGTVMLTHAYFLMGQCQSRQALDALRDYQKLLRWPSSIFRLTNDLSTSSAELARGETTNSIASYMTETGQSEEDARKHLNKLIDRDWKKINKAQFDDTVFEQPFLEAAANLAKTAHCIYLHGDGFGDPDSRAKNDIMSLVVEPIPVV